MKYKNYIFDQGNVVLDIDPQVSLEAFSKLIDPEKSGLVSASDLLGGCENQFITDYMLGVVSTEEFADYLMPIMKEGTTREQIVEAWNVMIGEFPQRRLDKLLELRRNGAKVYMLSNTNDAHMEHIIGHCFGGERERMMEYFDELFLSNEMHLAKPGVEIFEEMIRRTGMKPEESVYFDDLEQNVEGGRKAGLNAVLAYRDEWMDLV